MLFNAISMEHLSLGLISFVTIALLLNIRRYMARRAEAKINFRRTGTATREETDLRFLDSRDVAKQNAQVQPEASFQGTTHKPEAISKWEIEFFELTREMSAKLDVKMTAISTLTHDANRVCQRMERLIEQLEKLVERQSSHRAGSVSERNFTPGSVSERKEPTPESVRFPLSKAAYQRHSKDEPISGRPSFREDIFVHESSGSGETKKNESLFPRLTSIPDLGFSEDIDDLTAIGSDIFNDDPLCEKPETVKPDRPSPEQVKSVSAFHSPYKQSQAVPKPKTEKPKTEKTNSPGASQTLGELLLQNTNREQAAKLQPTPRIVTAQQTLTHGKEALFMPIGEK